MSEHSKSSRAGIYTRIANEIIAAMDAGPFEFTMPWHHDGSRNASGLANPAAAPIAPR
jgi:antirestriction protein ArdC